MGYPLKFLASGHAKPFATFAAATIMGSIALAIWKMRARWISYVTCTLWVLVWFLGMLIDAIAGSIG